MIQKLQFLFNLFYHIRDCLNYNSKFLCYYSFVQSILSYATFIFANTSKGNIEKLFVLQKKLIKCLFKKNYSFPSSLLFKDLKLLSFPDLIKFSNFRFIVNSLFGQNQPSYSSKLFLDRFSFTSKRYFNFILFKKPKNYFDLFFKLLEFFNNLKIEKNDKINIKNS